MTTLKITDSMGKDAGTIEVSDFVFGIEPSVPVVHQVVRAQLSWLHQGTHDSKTRGMVSGGGRKPFKQKGTGRARQGTSRAPQMRGGGVVFGPHPRSHALKVQKRMVKLAMRSVLSGKLADGELLVVDDFAFDAPSTKSAKKMLEALGAEGRTTVVVKDDNIDAFLSFRNLPKVTVLGQRESNTYDLLDNKTLILTKSAVEYLEGVLQ